MKVLDLEGLGYFWTKIKNKFYIKPDTGIPKSDLSSEVQGSLNKADTALLTETDPIFTASPAHGISSEDIIYWDNKLEKLSAVKIIGSIYRTNVSGSGSISIQGNVGLFPVVLEAGTYTVVTDMLSNTNSYGLSVNCGGNTYTLNTTDGHIHDSREITIPANGRWSGTVIGSVAGNSMISVKIEKVADEVTEIALVGITNDYNDLDNKPILTNYFDGAVYDSNTKRINFKNGNVVKAYIDATAFIKDGMVDNVEIEDGKLIITFNTESGKEPIELDITAIFDPSNYYDKSTIDDFLDDKANVADLATVATSGEYSDLINPPTNVSDFTNDVGYLTEHQDISGKANISDLDDVAFSGDYSDLSNVPTNVSSFNNDAGYLTEHQSLSNYYTKSETDNLLDDKADTSDLATVATSGDYNDLTNKPTIPSAQVNSDWNATSGVALILNKPDIPSVSQTTDVGTSIIIGDNAYDIVLEYPSGNETTVAPSVNAVNQWISEVNFRNHVDGTSIDVTADDELYVKSLSADRLTNGTNNKVFTASELTKLAGIATGAEVNVLSDWNETNTSSDAFIKNKPTIPDAQIQSDWDQTDTTAKDYIKNKPNLTNNNGSLNIKPYDWYGGDINIETGFDGGNITIFGGDALYLKSGDDDIYIGGGEYTSIKLLSNTYYKNKEIAVKDDIKVTSVNGMTGAVNLSIPDDSNLVHKTGDETIYQNKTFAHEIHLTSGWEQIYDDDSEKSLREALNERDNVQSDWNQTTTTAPDYIKNKPEIPSKLSDLTQDINYAASGTDGGAALKTGSIPFGVVDSTSTSTAFTATVPGITELTDGTCVLLKNGVVTSAAGFTININGLGAHHAFSNMTAATAESTIFNINYTMLFVYDSTREVGGVTGAWCCYRGYDSNTNTIGYQLRSNSYTKAMAAITYRYRILFSSADNSKWVPANTSSSTNATASKTVCQTPINPFGEIVYYGTTASVAAGSRPAAASLWQQYTLALGYSFNRTGKALTLTPWEPVYVKCAPQANGSAIIDSTTPYVQSLPSTDDGKIYIFLGVAYSATNIELLMNHPVFYYKDGAIRSWANTADTTLGTLNTNNTTALTTSSSESFGSTINLHKVSKTGSYNDLLNKPTIPDDSNLVHKTGNETISGTKTFRSDPGSEVYINSDINKYFGEAPLNNWDWIQVTGKGGLNETLQQALDERNNVQSDWAETNNTSYAYIKNKPSIPNDSNLVHKTGNETINGIKTFGGSSNIKLSSTIERHVPELITGNTLKFDWIKIHADLTKDDLTLQQALDERNNVQSDWNLTTTTADDYIKNKPINVSSFNNDAGYLTEHQDISGKLDVITDLDTIRAGAALGSTAYQKPSTGIPKSDLAQSVQTSLGKADTALQQHQDLSSYADGAEYDSTNHFIYLKHGNTRLANPINANDFIKDGMVDTVAVTGGNLVITFNTDSGKLPITIPISDIFDANNYYTKTEIDNAGYITEHQSLNNYYTKSEVDTKTAKTTARSDSKLLYNGQSVEAVISNTGFSNTNNLLNNGFNMAIRSNSTNPFIGLKEGNNLWYAQAASNYFYFGPTSTKALRLDLAGNGVFQTGSVTATKIIKSGGTSSLFLKADGSVDNNTYLTSFTETDPTVPAWAKASTKPTYTAAEVGALPDTTVIPDAPGTLNTNNSTAQTVSSSESLSGTINLHKISKTGNYNDLLNKPTIPAVDIALTNSEIDTIWNNVMN